MLSKKLTSAWSRSVKRLMKTQQSRNKKLVQLLLTPSKPLKPPKPVHRSSTAAASKPALPKTPKLVAVRAKLPLPVITQPAPGKWLKFTYAVPLLEGGQPGVRMSYWLYLPDNAASSSLPLVVMLHGCTQTATQFAQSTRMNQLAEKKGFAVLYPQQTTAHNASRCWRWYKKTTQDGGAEAKMVADMITEVLDNYALDKSRVYIAGISAGAGLANIIALNYPQLIAAVGMHSGAAFGAAETPVEGYNVMQRGAGSALHSTVRDVAARVVQFPLMPAILIHGQADKVVRPVNLAHLAEQFRELHQLAGYPRESVQVTITDKPGGARSGNAYRSYEYSARRKNLLKVCEISELGHAWSGGDESVKFSTAKGPDASKMMWAFFSRHRRLHGRLTVNPGKWAAS